MQPVWPKLVQKFRSQSSSWLKPEKLTQLQGESREHTPTLWDPSHLSQSIVPIDSSPHPSSFRNLSLERGGRGGRRVGDNQKQSSFPVVAVVVVVVVVVVSGYVIICLSLKFIFIFRFLQTPCWIFVGKRYDVLSFSWLVTGNQGVVINDTIKLHLHI